MENDEKMIPEVEQSEACVPEQPTAPGKCAGSNSQEIKDADPLPLTKTLGISEEGLRTLRAEAQRTFDDGAVAGIAFYKASRRPIFGRLVAWYGGTINRAAGQYGQRLADAAAYHKGFRPKQRQAIEEEVQDFARKKIDQRVARGWLGLFLVNRDEPGFSKMVTRVTAELADQESSLISEARANLNQAAAIYRKKPRMRRYSERRSTHVQSNREKEIREIASLGFKGLSYCREMDRRQISGDPEWLNNEQWPGTYEGAYRQGKKWQKRIQQEKWRICPRGKISAVNH
jgi:hypothetical protein